MGEVGEARRKLNNAVYNVRVEVKMTRFCPILDYLPYPVVPHLLELRFLYRSANRRMPSQQVGGGAGDTNHDYFEGGLQVAQRLDELSDLVSIFTASDYICFVNQQHAWATA